jgi:ribosomal-protein-alanine N-acetyltransferase
VKVTLLKIEDIYSSLPQLETERLILRKLKPSDVNDMFNYCSDKEISRYTIWYSHQTIEDTRSFMDMLFEKYERNDVAPWGIVDKASERLIGTTGFISWDTLNAKAEIGYALSRLFWNKGYMTEAVKKVISFGFEQMDLVRIEARCHPDNLGSAKVMEKSGMLYEGTLRKHILAKGVHEDVKMYAIIKDAL